jgi:hypothetical protein
MINGAILPSTEPDKKAFSFDVVPSSLVDNIIINKTATPEMTGEFTGGLIQITTKDIPTKNLLSFGLGLRGSPGCSAAVGRALKAVQVARLSTRYDHTPGRLFMPGSRNHCHAASCWCSISASLAGYRSNS